MTRKIYIFLPYLFIFLLPLLAEAQKFVPSNAEIYTLLNKAKNIEDTNLLDSALHSYQRLRIQTQNRLEILTTDTFALRIQIQAYIAEGNLYFRKADYHLAISVLNLALQKAKTIPDGYSIAETLHRLGSCYAMLGEHETALENFNKAILLQRSFVNKKPISKTLNNIGYIFFLQKEYTRALDYYAESLGYKILQKDTNGMISTLNNMGIAYLKLNQLDSCRHYLEIANQYSKLSQNPMSLLRSYTTFGEYLLQIGDFKKALYYLQKALEQSAYIADQYELAYLKLLIATSYQKMGKIAESKEFANQCYKLAIRHNIAEIRLETIKLIAQNYSYENNDKAAYQLSKEYATERDSFSSRSRQARIIELDMVYRADMMDKKINLQQAQIELRKVEERRTKYIHRLYFVLGVGLIILILFALYSYRVKTNAGKKLLYKQQHIIAQRRQIQKQYNQIEINSAEMISRNEEIEAQKESFAQQTQAIERQTRTLEELSSELVGSLWYAQTIQRAVFEPFEKTGHPLIADFKTIENNGIVSTSFIHKIIRSDRAIYLIFESEEESTPGAMLCLRIFAKLQQWLEEINVWRTESIYQHLNERLGEEKSLDTTKTDSIAFTVVAFCVQSASVEIQGVHSIWISSENGVTQATPQVIETQQFAINFKHWSYLLSNSTRHLSINWENQLNQNHTLTQAEQDINFREIFRSDLFHNRQSDLFIFGMKPNLQT